MRRPDELVDGSDRFESISTSNQNCGIAGEGGGIAGDGDNGLDLATRDLPGLRFGPGARRIENDRIESDRALAGISGSRKRSRLSALTGFSPCVPRAACASAATAAASLSTASTRARSARRKAKGPMPQKRSATRLALPTASTTNSASVCSPSAVACRKDTGGTFSRRAPDGD